MYPQAQLNFSRQTYVRALAFRDYERLFEEEFGVRRSPGRAGAFLGDSERSTSWEGFTLQAGSAPTEALAFSVTVAGSWDVFDYDFGAGPSFPASAPQRCSIRCAARSGPRVRAASAATSRGDR